MNDYKCKVCGCEFMLLSQNRYTADATPGGPFSVLCDTLLQDAFDCPMCGCQNIVGRRYQKYDDATDYLEEADPEEAEADAPAASE